MTKMLDLTGHRFGRLVAQRRFKVGTLYKWECICDCGNVTSVYACHLRGGKTVSCGCKQHECHIGNAYRKKHGMWKASEFHIWQGMNQRCHNPAAKGYRNYGARGITVCDEWREDFLAFYNHIGPRPSPRHSVDRIDNDKGYQPGNVRWATSREQGSNRRGNIKVQFGDEVLTLAELARRHGIPEPTVLGRFHRGLTGADLVAVRPARKLTPEDIARIRSDLRFQKEIAESFGITQSHVSAIKTGRLWRDA